MKKQNRMLNVLMNGVLVGHLEKNTNGSLTFSYDQSWLETPGARPISLSLPLIKQRFVGDAVYNFFDNLLPDNPRIRVRIQAKFAIQTDQAFDLLAIIGRDCVGAIQLIEGVIPKYNKDLRGKTLKNHEIAALLRDVQNNPLGMTDDNDDFRISIAGAQEKSAFLFYKKKWHTPIGTTPSSHIFKLPIGFIQHQHLDLSESCENEWLCAIIAEAFGLPVAKCKIKQFDDIKTLIVERFDRKYSNDKKWLMRTPQEDICQALGISANLKYQSDGGPGIKQIMRFLLGSLHPNEDRDTFFRAQILFHLLAAIDGHAKNFSLFIKPEGKYRLTPLYDIMSAYPLMKQKQLQAQKIKMAMALEGKNKHYHWHNIQRRHFIETAKTASYSPQKAEQILDEMLKQVEAVIQKVSRKLPRKFPTKISQPIFEGMLNMKRKLSH